VRAEVKLHSTSSTAHTKIREDADDVRRMMLILISEAISNSNAVIRREFGKLRFQMIDDSETHCNQERTHRMISFQVFAGLIGYHSEPEYLKSQAAIGV
jgi:hypothetical protein